MVTLPKSENMPSFVQDYRDVSFALAQSRQHDACEATVVQWCILLNNTWTNVVPCSDIFLVDDTQKQTLVWPWRQDWNLKLMHIAWILQSMELDLRWHQIANSNFLQGSECEKLDRLCSWSGYKAGRYFFAALYTHSSSSAYWSVRHFDSSLLGSHTLLLHLPLCISCHRDCHRTFFAHDLVFRYSLTAITLWVTFQGESGFGEGHCWQQHYAVVVQTVEDLSAATLFLATASSIFSRMSRVWFACRAHFVLYSLASDCCGPSGLSRR